MFIVRLVLGIVLACGISAASMGAGKPSAITPSQQLLALGDEFYLAMARFDPVGNATFQGDGRFDDQLNIYIDPVQRSKFFAQLHQLLKRLNAIKRDRLSSADALTYDVLEQLIAVNVSAEQFPDHLLPLEHMSALPVELANFATGQAEQPLTTVKQYDAYLKRISRLPQWIDQAMINMHEGMRRGIVQPRSIVQAMLPPLKALTVELDSNPFYLPIRNMPGSFVDEDRVRLQQQYKKTVQHHLIPAMQKLVTFIEGEYLSASRNTDGWSAMPNGAQWYRRWVRFQTTTDLDPEVIHAIGLKEVARIQSEVAKLAPKLGYEVDSNRLLAWVLINQRFMPFKSETEILDAYRAINEKVKAHLPQLFGRIPKAALDILPEPALTREGASDHYSVPAEDGSRPGIFWAVITDPTTYNLSTMGSLFLHEGQPGHHFHLALQNEIALPQFRKRASINAFAEGWALYAETLGHEMGLYDDPVLYAGNLRLEMMRAVRLVVDTGIHTKGWTHDQAIAYMVDNTGYSEAQARNQIERYMIWPGQALGYKIGALKIQELRERAKQALGVKFNLAAFHDAILAEGSLPLSVLEMRINQWIEQQR